MKSNVCLFLITYKFNKEVDVGLVLLVHYTYLSPLPLASSAALFPPVFLFIFPVVVSAMVWGGGGHGWFKMGRFL